MKPKILLFGGGGFIGGNLAALAYRNAWEVFIAGRTARAGLNFAQWKPVDITALAQVERLISNVQPQAVVNLAAMAAIDQVEIEPQLAWQVNVEGARHIAASCARNNIRHIYLSSDAIFDGKSSSYAEDARPNPVNYYGRTKAAAETAVQKICPDDVVVRISLALGFSLSGGNSLLDGLAAKLKSGSEIVVQKNEVRTPVDVITLSECLLEIVKRDFNGIIHIGSTDAVDRCTLARKIVSRMGYDEGLVVLPQAKKPDPNRAPRHRNGVLEIAKAERLLTTRLLSVDEGVRRAFDERIHPSEV